MLKTLMVGPIVLLTAVLALGAQADDRGCGISTNNSGSSVFNNEDRWYQVHGTVEGGFIGVLNHKLQFGRGGSRFDYVADGGQNVLFPFQRYTVEVGMKDRHCMILLYQPLDVRTEAVTRQALIVYDDTFPAGTPIKLKYGFSFWRASYLYDFNADDSKEIAVGLSFQIRNASISFASADGRLQSINQNIGPVPIFKFRTRLPLGHDLWWGTEIDGFYASGKYITGSGNDFTGAIYDASLRLGGDLRYVDPYLNIRFIGGGANGTEEDDPDPGDGYTDNWLHTAQLTIGIWIE